MEKYGIDTNRDSFGNRLERPSEITFSAASFSVLRGCSLSSLFVQGGRDLNVLLTFNPSLATIP